MTKIKICGLTRIEDTEYVNEVLPEYIGFVFWEKSRRNVSYEDAKKLREMIDDRIISVGVFVDADIEFIGRLVRDKIISVVQLHGKETDETIASIRNIVPNDTIIVKAFEVASEADVEMANKSSADMVLIDSGKGSGKTFDWNLLERINREYFLAGGLSIENVGEAVSKLHPCVVDVSSKVETDGFKDRKKIKEFCEAVRS